MIEVHDKNKCVGCGACVSVCPVFCIHMKPDDEGFLYPEVDKDLCIGCGKCERVCPVLHPKEGAGQCAAYAAKSSNEQIRKESSSGGVFTEIAQYILSKGGVVLGAAFDEGFRVKHVCVEDAAWLGQLRGSKYVQSEIGNCFQEAKAFLKAGKLVLFTGTPCQIGGLHGFLGKEYENLYTQDVICHGVPSPAIWEQYVKYREEKAGAKTKRVLFRNKENGWRNYSISFEFQNNKLYDQPSVADVYMQSFLKDLSLRPSCYACAYKTKTRCSDITLADFWGVQNCNPSMDDNRGTSLVLIHSDKGQVLFDAVKDNLEAQETSFEQAISFNPAMVKSVPLKPERSAFIKDVFCEDFAAIQKRYLREKFAIRMKRKVKNALKRIVK